MTTPTYANLSVIIPCYRCASTIERSVKSIAMQTMLPREVILVDDKSGDNTVEKLIELKNSYPLGWIKVITLTKNGGPSTARNSGWNAATQDYIAFLDADDSWHEKKIEIQYSWMMNNPSAKMSGHLCGVIRNKNLPPKHEELHTECVTPIKVTKGKLLLANKFQTPTVIIKRVIELRMNEAKRYSEDYDLWLRMAFDNNDCYLFNMELAYLYKAPFGEGGLSGNLIEIEKGELANYLSLYRTGKIHFVQFAATATYSIAKFIRRYLIVQTRNLMKAS